MATVPASPYRDRMWRYLVLLAACAGTPHRVEPHDGEHDFDFALGRWHTHIERRLHPLTGSTTWVSYDGTSNITPLWHGRANIVELDVSGAGGRIEGVSIRLYDPAAKQWSLNYANASIGALGTPTIGDPRRGMFDQETYNNRAILVRNVFTDITPTSYHFEQAFSDDGGVTWEVNWVSTDVRM